MAKYKLIINLVEECWLSYSHTFEYIGVLFTYIIYEMRTVAVRFLQTNTEIVFLKNNLISNVV